MLRNEALVALEVRALSRACWLRREMLEALAEVNHRCLGLLAEQALVALGVRMASAGAAAGGGAVAGAR